tara:strand:+ start:498 stop:1193 length:696 start_codon:yes stop_codon:yes gene_type:complete
MKNNFRQFIGNFHTMSRIYSEGGRLIKHLKNSKISTVFDVGANVGQYAQMLRRFGYKGKIISFEPLEKEKNILDVNMILDKQFESYNYAIGKKNSIGKINYALNSVSSSIFKSHPRHIKYNKGTISKEKKKIVIKNLKNFKSKIEKSKTLLKLDTQGYEYEILSSAESMIKYFKIIQLETSFRKVYYSEKNWLKSLELLQKNGFYIIDIFYGIRNSNLELMQCDLILKRFK